MINNRTIPDNIEKVKPTQYATQHLTNDRRKILYERLMLCLDTNKHTVFEPHTGDFTIDLPNSRIKEALIEAINGSKYDANNDTISVTYKGKNLTITDEDIASYIKIGISRSYHNVITTPFYPTVYKDNGKKVLNTWSWNGIDYDKTTDIENAKPFFDWLYYLICGGFNEEDSVTKKTSDYLDYVITPFDDLDSEAARQFHIIMHWAAERYQQPLKCANTTLLLTSTGQTIGKSTLAAIIGRVIDYGFNRPIDTNNFMDKYDDDIRAPGIIDVSDLVNLSPASVEKKIKERVRTSTGKRTFNLKSSQKPTGYYHCSYIISANDSDFILIQKGQTSRFHMIEGITSERKELLSEEVAQVLSNIKAMFPADNLPRNASGDHLAFLQAISMVLDNVEVNSKITDSSDDFKTKLLTSKISTTSGELERIFLESYSLMKEKESRNSGWTVSMSYNDLYNLIIVPNPALNTSLKPPALKAIITKSTNVDFVKLDKAHARGQFKICNPKDVINSNSEDNDTTDDSDNNVIRININESALDRLKRSKGR